MDQLPRWALGLALGIECINGQRQADSPMRRITVSTAPGNPYGVLEHHVALPDSTTGHHTFRVAQAGPHGFVFSFVVPRQPGADAASPDADARAVERDLQALKRLLETPAC